MMLKVLNWPLIMSPSDYQDIAAVVLVVRFPFLLYFLAQVATKNRILVLFYGVLNSQLVEQRTGNAEVTGSNPVEALIFFRLLLSNCLNCKIYCDDHSSLSSLCYLGYFLVLREPTLLFCVVDIDQFSSLHHQETTLMQCIIAVCLHEFVR